MQLNWKLRVLFLWAKCITIFGPKLPEHDAEQTPALPRQLSSWEAYQNVSNLNLEKQITVLRPPLADRRLPLEPKSIKDATAGTRTDKDTKTGPARKFQVDFNQLNYGNQLRLLSAKMDHCITFNKTFLSHAPAQSNWNAFHSDNKLSEWSKHQFLSKLKHENQHVFFAYMHTCIHIRTYNTVCCSTLQDIAPPHACILYACMHACMQHTEFNSSHSITWHTWFFFLRQNPALPI